VPCELHVEPGMYHGADAIAGKVDSMRAFRTRMVAVLGEARLCLFMATDPVAEKARLAKEIARLAAAALVG
jgi:hypothetical protein